MRVDSPLGNPGNRWDNAHAGRLQSWTNTNVTMRAATSGNPPDFRQPTRHGTLGTRPAPARHEQRRYCGDEHDNGTDDDPHPHACAWPTSAVTATTLPGCPWSTQPASAQMPPRRETGVAHARHQPAYELPTAGCRLDGLTQRTCGVEIALVHGTVDLHGRRAGDASRERGARGFGDPGLEGS